MTLTKYIPFTQQKYCCVPTCLLMVMYRHAIPLMAAEDLAYALGLTVPADDVSLFSNARTGTQPSAGWGTRINEPKFEVNSILQSLNIPLHVEIDTVISSVAELRAKLDAIQESDGDALLCFDYGTLWKTNIRSGHVCVFDRLEDEDIWVIDPEQNVPKQRRVSVQQMYEAITAHGPQNSAGIWKITKIVAS